MFETIVALATPPGKSALAIIRLSGNDCLNIVNKVFDKDILKTEKRAIYHGYILDNSDKIDEVVLLVYVAPNSFTGENSVEILSHGSMIIVNQIISLLLKNGARLATNGEFSSRAYLNKKIDLVQAEAINDVINAETIEAKDLSLKSLTGLTSKLFYPIKVELVSLLSNIEVNIDYSEVEDIEVVTNKKVIDVCSRLIKKINELIEVGQRNSIYKSGVNVALVGKPNVGKSSLLNALLNEEKAIVTNIAGTTRDVVEGTYNLNGVILHLFDTAGYRKVNDQIERLGVKKTLKAIEDADLVVYIYDETGIDDELLNSIKNKKIIKIRNKADLNINKKENEIEVSAINSDFKLLLEEIKKALSLDEIKVSPSFVNVRQLSLLRKMVASLTKAKNDAENNIPIDLIAVNVHSAYNDALDLLGESGKVDLAKEIFSRFCVGK